MMMLLSISAAGTIRSETSAARDCTTIQKYATASTMAGSSWRLSAVKTDA